MNPSTGHYSSTGNRVAQREALGAPLRRGPPRGRPCVERKRPPPPAPASPPLAHLAPLTRQRRRGMRLEAEERGGRGARPKRPASKPPRGGDIPIPRGNRCVGGEPGVVVGEEKKKKKDRPGSETEEFPFFVLSPVCGSVTVSDGAWSVSGPPKSSVPASRVSPDAFGARGETEAVVAGEGRGVRAPLRPRGIAKPARSRVPKALLPRPPRVPTQLPRDALPPGGPGPGREGRSSGSGFAT